MKQWVAIVTVTPEGRVGKYLDFETEADARAHVAKHGGFAMPSLVEPLMDWRIVGEEAAIDKRPAAPPPRDIFAELDALKARIATLEGPRVSR